MNLQKLRNIARNSKTKIVGSMHLIFLEFCLLVLIFLFTLRFAFGFNFHQIIEILANFVAVFLGAYFAFTFSANREKQLRIETYVVNSNLALFNLIEYFNSLENYRLQIIEPVREHPLRLISMPPYNLEDSSSQKIESNTLSFMLENAEGANLLGRMVVAEKSVRSLSANIKVRAQLHIEVVQPAMVAAGLKEGEPLSLDDIRDVIGDRNFCVLRDVTEEIIASVDDSIAKLKILVADMHAACIGKFPGNKFVKIVNP